MCERVCARQLIERASSWVATLSLMTHELQRTITTRRAIRTHVMHADNTSQQTMQESEPHNTVRTCRASSILDSKAPCAYLPSGTREYVRKHAYIECEIIHKLWSGRLSVTWCTHVCVEQRTYRALLLVAKNRIGACISFGELLWARCSTRVVSELERRTLMRIQVKAYEDKGWTSRGGRGCAESLGSRLLYAI